MKECGTCVQCCDGVLHGDIHGHYMGNGKPCFFLDKGCTIYENRPEHPCQVFKCLWISDETIPDYIKPENANAIATISYTKSGIKFLNVVERDTHIPADVLEYCQGYAKDHDMTCFWSVDQRPHYEGKYEVFKEIMTYGINTN